MQILIVGSNNSFESQFEIEFESFRRAAAVMMQLGFAVCKTHHMSSIVALCP